MNEISAKFVEDTRVKDSYSDSIDSEVVSEKNIIAVVHNSKSDFAHGIATVFEIALEQIDLREVEDWVFWRQFVKRNRGLREVDEGQVVFRCFGVGFEREVGLVFYLLGGCGEIADCAFVGGAECPVARFDHLSEVFDLAGVLVLPMFGLLYSD